MKREFKRAFYRAHPQEAATLLQTFPQQAITSELNDLPPPVASKVLQAFPLPVLFYLIEELNDDLVREYLLSARLHVMHLILEHCSESQRIRISQLLPKSSRLVLANFKENQQHHLLSLLDQHVLAFHQDTCSKDVMKEMNRSKKTSSRYYVTDASQKLVGYVDLQDLLQSKSSDKLGQIMKPVENWVYHHMEIKQVLSLGDWQTHSVLPVITPDYYYLGAINLTSLFRYFQQNQLGLSMSGLELLVDVMAAGVEALLNFNKGAGDGEKKRWNK